MLDRYPTALVTALNADGLLMAVPGALRLTRQRLLEGRALADWAVVKDRIVIATTFFEARRNGWAQSSFRLLSSPDAEVTLHLVDLLSVHGAVLAVIAPEGRNGPTPEFGIVTPAQSRLAAYRQNNMGFILECDESSAAMVGLDVQQMIGRQGLELVHPDDQAHVIDVWLEVMATKQSRTMRYRHRRGERAWFWVDGTLHNHLGEADRNYVQVEVIDVSEEMAAKEALEAQQLLLNQLVDVLPVGLLQIGVDRAIGYTNARLHAILATPHPCTLDELLVNVEPADRLLVDDLLTRTLAHGTDADIEIGLTIPDTREPRRCQLSMRALLTRTVVVSGAIVCISDTTDSARMRRELEDKATFDPVTRCHNRASITGILERELAASAASRTAVIFIDLDKFKPINDLLGHDAGDELLAIVARRLRGCLRADDALGRLGGDEFLIVCPAVSGAVEAMRVAERISGSISTAINIRSHTVDVKASIGVALATPAISAKDLVAAADAAMYQSKRAGFGRPVASDGANQPV